MLKRIVAWFRAVRHSFSPWCDACELNSASIPHAADCVRAGALQIGFNGQVTEFGIDRPHTKIPPVITRTPVKKRPDVAPPVSIARARGKVR